MAQSTTSTMGPPSSLRETRRSGRRSAPSASTSNSQSPPPEPSSQQTKDKPRRPSLNSNNSRNRRLKQEDIEDSINGSKSTNSNSSSTRQSNSNGHSKRKGKEKEKQSVAVDLVPDSSVHKSKPSVSSEEPALDVLEEEEQGITRCVCGSTGEDDPDAGEFMVQCETCKVWQHGLCMGYESEDQLHDDDYYCEKCRPELHQDLLKKLAKKARQSSTTSHHNTITTASRLSRSHSPSFLAKPSKRRNTMNSRDAAFDESLKEIMEATAAEAAAQDSRSSLSNGNANGRLEPKDEFGSNSRKKRKRRDDDASGSKKRNRSASTTPDQPAALASTRDGSPVIGSGSKPAPVVVPASRSQTSRSKRSGTRKHVVHEPVPSVEGEEASQLVKRHIPSSRAKGAPQSKRGPLPATSHAPGSTAHEHGTRRNYSNGAGGGSNTPAHANTSAESSRAYRNSHAYAVSQQPLFTSWNLPDYLAHLEPMLPSDVPRPLEVRGSGLPPGMGTEGGEKTMERGVKVKWPSKRMSVGDMNKRVRALVEWVGREQASAMDRGRRREALERAYREVVREQDVTVENGELAGGDPKSWTSTGSAREAESPLQERHNVAPPEYLNPTTTGAKDEGDLSDSAVRSSNMKSMEALMEELISFQERFGPGAKTRERRLASMAA